YRTKEDDVYKISTSVFIMNFPESCSAKELFQSCKQYGHVVDTFIPNKRSKTRRRFHRTPLNRKKSMPKKAGGVKKDTRVNEVGNPYVHVVKGQMQPENKESKATPALVLSDECLLSKDLSKSLFGRVKQFAALANIRKADEMCFHSKRLCIYTTSEMNIFEEFKIIFRGRSFWIRAKEAPGWVPDFMDEKHTNKQENHSRDPFSICKLLKKKKNNVGKENNSEHSMKYPLGFTPKEGTDVVGMHTEESKSDNIVNMSDHNAEEVDQL
nr:nucleotide-binding alpha-beta plait domain-containing protein [Tanacetum cinerariifolium]